MSDSIAPQNRLAVASLLAIVGGFLDAFTDFDHGHVFANGMTGKVVLLGVSLAVPGFQSFSERRCQGIGRCQISGSLVRLFPTGSDGRAIACVEAVMTDSAMNSKIGQRCRRSRWLIAAGVTGIAIAGAFASWAPFGGRARGARLRRMQKSPEWKGSHFENPQPIVNDNWASIATLFHADPNVSPHSPLRTVMVEPSRFASPPPSGLRVTWLGHSTILLEIDGHRFLMDPVWSDRASPTPFAGPKRWFPPLLALRDLPPLDAVVLSHDHYDHLDYATIMALKDRNLIFVAPLGVGAHLERWGVPPTKIVELDWWDSRSFGDLTLHATPARHASGRVLGIDGGAKLWTGYAFLGPRHRVYYSGDTGLFPGLRMIGDRLGPFDLTMIEIGQYDQAWPDWHLGPEQAVEAHRRVRGAVMLPVHWGLFALASHGWTEPIERVVVQARTSGAVLITPRPGQSVEPALERPQERWWTTLPWRTAAENPIVAHHAD